jgi:phosphoribosylaminoimidazolecarboxamide formyltransferase/IMP cyclohydrolase
MKIETALVSVYDKEGVVELGRRLVEMGVAILSTGGTAKALREAGVPVVAISEHTGFPEILDGRVKTLHPRVHGGILARHDDPVHQKALQEHEITPIGLVVVNLYPFKETIQKPGVTTDEAIEQIDIGGPTMIRAAAKNHQHTTVVVDPEDYANVLSQMAENDGATLVGQRRALASKAFHHTAAYDTAIAGFFRGLESDEEGLPQVIDLGLELKSVLRYGENPHQKAALYRPLMRSEAGLVGGQQHQGKELSFNNYWDLESAWNLCQEFQDPACAIIKHTNPCGTALGLDLAEAYQKALACDPVSAFGSIIALNRQVNEKTAELISQLFVECVIAPAYDAAALTVFSRKKNLRVMEMAAEEPESRSGLDFKKISGGFLVQERDVYRPLENLKTVTKRSPTDQETKDLLFAWTVSKHVKSNAIILGRDGQTLGVGAGQMSRVDSVRLASEKAQLVLENCVMASDGFFPFRDAVDEAVQAGVRAIIQPGGSKRDEEVIAAADEHGVAMVLTGVRHFKH